MKPALSILPEREAVETPRRRALPLATRYAVIKRQCPADIVEEVERKGGKLKDRYAKLRYYATCAMTGERLIVKGCEYDHRVPRALGGTDDPENIQALTPAAHRRKTDADDAAIAKANRCKLYHETGRSSAAKHVKKIGNRPFDKGLRKRMDGTVERRT